MINRQKLIEDIEREFDGVTVYDVSGSQAASDFIDIVYRQPPADQWIPCDGHPPKEPCIYTVEDYSPYTLDRYGEPQRRVVILKPFMWEMYDRVIAWKPIDLEPYKGVE